MLKRRKETEIVAEIQVVKKVTERHSFINALSPSPKQRIYKILNNYTMSSDVRRLLKKQKLERQNSSRISHPFAKYDDTGRLICIVCKSPVKNENVWQAHLGSNHHKENIEKLKALKQQKRPAAEPVQTEPQQKRVRFEDIELSDEEEEEEGHLPADFFDQNATEEPMDEDIVEDGVEDNVKEMTVKPNTIPAGFFDDPEREAKAQAAAQEQAKLQLEKELNEFQEAMLEVATESQQQDEEDDELLYAGRNEDIFREQALLDARVQRLKQMRETGKVTREERQDEGLERDEQLRKDLKKSLQYSLSKKKVQVTQSVFDDDEDDEEDG